MLLWVFDWFFTGNFVEGGVLPPGGRRSKLRLSFSLDFCEGRISKNTFQIALNTPQILPLPIFSVLTPGDNLS